MKRAALAGFLLLLAAGAWAQLPAAWSGWRYYAPVELGAAADPQLASLVVPMGVTGYAQTSLNDLRVADDRGTEVPYILYSRQETRTHKWLDSQLLEVSFLPGENTQGIVDTGAGGQVHNSLEIVSSEPDYFVWVGLDVSTDAKSWRILRDRAPIYRFRKDGLEGNQVITYSPSLSRYLRVRVLDGNRQFALDGVRMAHEQVEEAERVPVDAPFAPDPAAPQQQTWLLADLGGARPFISEARFEVADAEFHRAVRISVSDDAKLWRTAAHGEIYRIKQQPDSPRQELREQLRVTFAESQGRLWRVELLNRNDQPLNAVRVTLHATPRRIVFHPEPGRTYRLVYGNPRAAFPQYSMARLVARKAIDEAAPVALGAQQDNSGYVDPTPWTEKNPFVLWLAVGIAVGALGWMAIRALRSPA